MPSGSTLLPPQSAPTQPGASGGQVSGLSVGPWQGSVDGTGHACEPVLLVVEPLLPAPPVVEPFGPVLPVVLPFEPVVLPFEPVVLPFEPVVLPGGFDEPPVVEPLLPAPPVVEPFGPVSLPVEPFEPVVGEPLLPLELELPGVEPAPPVVPRSEPFGPVDVLRPVVGEPEPVLLSMPFVSSVWQDGGPESSEPGEPELVVDEPGVELPGVELPEDEEEEDAPTALPASSQICCLGAATANVVDFEAPAHAALSLIQVASSSLRAT